MLFECHLDGVASLQDYVRPKVQTVTYLGFEREELIQIISEQSSSGVDRFVPVGRALEMGLVWDGKDIIRSLSKSVVIETQRVEGWLEQCFSKKKSLS